MEYEPLLIVLDLILHKPPAYRHLLFNRYNIASSNRIENVKSYKVMMYKLFTVYIFLDAFLKWCRLRAALPLLLETELFLTDSSTPNITGSVGPTVRDCSYKDGYVYNVGAGTGHGSLNREEANGGLCWHDLSLLGITVLQFLAYICVVLLVAYKAGYHLREEAVLAARNADDGTGSNAGQTTRETDQSNSSSKTCRHRSDRIDRNDRASDSMVGASPSPGAIQQQMQVAERRPYWRITNAIIVASMGKLLLLSMMIWDYDLFFGRLIQLFVGKKLTLHLSSAV